MEDRSRWVSSLTGTPELGRYVYKQVDCYSEFRSGESVRRIWHVGCLIAVL